MSEPPEISENEHIRMRKLHRDGLRERAIDPYGKAWNRTHYIAPLLARYHELTGEDRGEEVRIAGRLMALREQGKAAFANLVDVTGNIQIYFKLDKVGADAMGLLKLIDIGDLLGVEGVIFRTRRGELTIEVKSFDFLAKAVRPMPEKWHGLKDTELRYRERYVDLLSNAESRDTFIKRARIISAIRNYLDGLGFFEIETPTMSRLAGGATARPFITHHNALDLELYLRIATELYLKRLIVGGLEKVYELGRIFRNEGISPRHNPEFTMLELYEAYTDREGMMRITEGMLGHVCETVLRTYEVSFQGTQLNFKPPYERLSMAEGLKRHGNIQLEELRDITNARRIARELGIQLDPKATLGHIMDKVFEAVVEPHLVQPTFITDYPIELSPLAKRRADNPNITERFELFCNHFELVNAFSELNDPDDQRARFELQARDREAGDEEAPPVDEDYVKALEYGMPPTGGLGMGIDRLCMLLLDKPSIRDVIAFPLMKPAAREQQ